MRTRKHPAPESVAAFREGRLMPEEGLPIFRHLMACRACREAARPAVEAVIAGPDGPAAWTAEHYEFPLRKVENWVREVGAGFTRERADAERELLAFFAPVLPRSDYPLPGGAAGLRGWQRCEVLLEWAQLFRRHDPQKSWAAAQWAVVCAEKLDPERHPVGLTEDLRCRAWAELGNGWRLLGDLAEAEHAFQGALVHWQRGSEDFPLLARVMSLVGSLQMAQRRFEEAQATFRRVADWCDESGETLLAGRALLNLGTALGYEDRLEPAVAAFLDAADRLGRAGAAREQFVAIHNLIECQVRLGRFFDALRTQRRALPLYRRHATEMDEIKRRKVEGNIRAGLGNLGQADAILGAVEKEYERRGMPFHMGLTALDRASVWVRQGRHAELADLADRLVATFRALGIAREALAALLLFQEAARAERATLALVRTVAARVEKAGRG